MLVDLFGLTMETPGVTFYLWSPWRCSAIEHKLFESVVGLPNGKLEREPDEVRLHVSEAKAWKQAVQNMSRVLKGWQEEGVDANNEKRAWRWLIEADVDANGYDHKGEKAAFWLFLRLSMDRGGPAEDEEKAEDLDLNGFGVCVWGKDEK
ncbi:MAG: hypothetical protein JNK93_05440 [Planctomycetia bacterium]|nr:hypothetical protein [Planctomycetia bacterium]